MDKTKELIEILKNNPDRELIFMYPIDGSDDYPYTMGRPKKILIDEYWIDDERVWLKDEDGDELFEHYADKVFDDLYPHEKMANEEQEKIINKETEKLIDSQEWKKCICVYVGW